MAAGAFTLVIASVFATKANKKSALPTQLYYGSSHTPISSWNCSSTSILTTVSSSKTLFISPGTSTTLQTIFYYNSGYNPVNFNITL